MTRPTRDVRLRLRGLPSLGARDAAVTAVLFSHFGCAYNDRILSTFRAARRAHPGQLRLVFLLHGVNPARGTRWGAAAEVGLAAHAQGRFWALADLLFAGRTQIRRAQLPAWAASVGMRAREVRSALSRHSYRPEIVRQVRLARRFLRGPVHCPTLWVNGRVVSGYLSTSRIRRAFDRALVEVAQLQALPMP